MKKTFKNEAELFNEMMKLVILNVEGYQTDVLVDINYIKGKGSICSPYYWMVRTRGTSIKDTEREIDEDIKAWNNEYKFKAIIKLGKEFSLEIVDNKEEVRMEY